MVPEIRDVGPVSSGPVSIAWHKHVPRVYAEIDKLVKQLLHEELPFAASNVLRQSREEAGVIMVWK
jgi:hypothetical protein